MSSNLQQFEELARQYANNITEEKNQLQCKLTELQQKYERMEHHTQSLENEIVTLNIKKDDLESKVAKLRLNVESHEHTIQHLNSTILEYKNQNELLSQNTMHFKHTSHSRPDHAISNKTALKDIEAERDTLLSNNEKLKKLIVEHQNERDNAKLQNEELKGMWTEIKHINQQLLMQLNTKNETIHKLKQKSEDLQISNTELIMINNDLLRESNKQKQKHKQRSHASISELVESAVNDRYGTKDRHRNRNRVKRVSDVAAPYSETQIFIDEDEETIYASLNKSRHSLYK